MGNDERSTAAQRAIDARDRADRALERAAEAQHEADEAETDRMAEVRRHEADIHLDAAIRHEQSADRQRDAARALDR